MLASFISEASFTPDDGLVLSPTVSRKITLVSGQNLKRGSVLGRVNAGAAGSAAKSGGNTGNGTLTLDASTPVLPGAKAGIYTVRLITVAANSGTFRVTDPDGFVLGDVAVGATFSNDVKFATADGATDFALGDGFDITVAAGSGKFALSLAGAADGSQTPASILAEDCDASGGDKITVAYFGGTFDENACTYGTGHTSVTCREPLRDRSILLQSSLVR
jgi:hypothetical protein